MSTNVAIFGEIKMKILNYICEIIITILIIYITVNSIHFFHNLRIKLDQRYKKYQYTQIYNKYKEKNNGKQSFYKIRETKQNIYN